MINFLFFFNLNTYSNPVNRVNLLNLVSPGYQADLQQVLPVNLVM